MFRPRLLTILFFSGTVASAPIPGRTGGYGLDPEPRVGTAPYRDTTSTMFGGGTSRYNPHEMSMPQHNSRFHKDYSTGHEGTHRASYGTDYLERSTADPMPPTQAPHSFTSQAPPPMGPFSRTSPPGHSRTSHGCGGGGARRHGSSPSISGWTCFNCGVASGASCEGDFNCGGCDCGGGCL